jgi:hypothetical protein
MNYQHGDTENTETGFSTERRIFSVSFVQETGYPEATEKELRSVKKPVSVFSVSPC